MLQYFIVDYALYILALLGMVFVFTKFAMIYKYGVLARYPAIFFLSLRHVGRPVISNTEPEGAKRYLVVSNRVNMLFYVPGLALVGVFVLFKVV